MVSQGSVTSVTSAPDGGWGWVIVFSSFMIHALGVSTLLTLGVMYVSWLEEFQSSRALTSWIVSLAVAVFLTIGPIASTMISWFGYRVTVFIGGVLFSLGFCLSFFATHIGMLVVTIGIISGFGCGLCYLPAIAAVAVYFDKRRSLALGLATSGTGIGCLFAAPVYHWLIETYGWRGTLLIAGAWQLNLCALGLLMRPLQHTLQNDPLKPDQETAACLVSSNGADKDPAHKNGHSLSMLSSQKVSKENISDDHLTHQLLIPAATNGGSLSHLAASRDKISLRSSTSVTELSNKKLHQSNGGVGNSRGNLDILLSGSIHSLSMLDVSGVQPKPTAKLSASDERQARTHKPNVCLKIFMALFSNFALLRRPAFFIFILSNTLTNLSYLVPVLYMVDRAIESGIDKRSAAILVSVYGVGNVVGRIMSGVLGDRAVVNRTVLYLIILVVCGASICTSPLSGERISLHGFYAFIFGATIGAFTTMVPIVTVDIVGVSLVGQAYGVVLVFSGISGALGPPLAGLIYDWTGNFTASFIMHGVFVLLSAVVLLPVVLVDSLKQSTYSSSNGDR